MLVDIGAGLKLASSLESSGKLNHLMVCGIGMGQHAYLLFSKDFVLMYDTEDPIELSLSLTHICTKECEKI